MNPTLREWKHMRTEQVLTGRQEPFRRCSRLFQIWMHGWVGPDAIIRDDVTSWLKKLFVLLTDNERELTVVWSSCHSYSSRHGQS